MSPWRVRDASFYSADVSQTRWQDCPRRWLPPSRRRSPRRCPPPSSPPCHSGGEKPGMVRSTACMSASQACCVGIQNGMNMGTNDRTSTPSRPRSALGAGHHDTVAHMPHPATRAPRLHCHLGSHAQAAQHSLPSIHQVPSIPAPHTLCRCAAAVAARWCFPDPAKSGRHQAPLRTAPSHNRRR